ncbi:MAG: dihydroxyacetone kinase subunit L [Selenomonadaceae bacterium]|nr:dihydroxyacetone kinase subunit L [Selenomonadaceae bacterium]
MIRGAIEAVIKAILNEKDFLNELDEKIGDGDHGLNMASGARAVGEALDELDDDADLKKILHTLGEAITDNVGGSAGPLYGAALLEAAKVVDKNSALNVVTLEKIFGAAVEAIQKRGNAQRGEKTMLDVLIPIHESFKPETCAGKSLEEILTQARDAARDGLEFTKTIAAKKGRAAALGNKSIGFEDPGAASSLIIFRTLCGKWKDSFRE